MAKELRGLGAFEFKGEVEEGLVAANLWLNDLKIILDSLHCSEVEKLDAGVSLLRGQATIWWTNVTISLASGQVNWSLFLEDIKHKYIGDQFIRKIKKEFMNLKQMNRTVYEYECEFNKLSRFADAGHFIWDCPLITGESAPSERIASASQRGRVRGRNQSESSVQPEIRSTARVYNLKTSEDCDDPNIIAARKLLLQGCQGFLANVIDNIVKEKGLDEILIVREFPDVFPLELPGLPLDREVEFQIDMMSGTTPITMAPYRMAPKELQELKS
ncbi:uncharacterized protein LOC120177640 [Hibiscus syriacus]|uniref:uncharacterized protein LOC120177640 n=1 Tax=Hibiscus syriacus TaxID=106335 RepID=UPI0019206523|nr:uncharacterized protein LOC120177640 [Hibiscus syriacus]